MNRLVRFFHGGTVKEIGEFENMNEDLELFHEPPTFKDLVDRVTLKYLCRGDDVEMRGRFDCGKARSHIYLRSFIRNLIGSNTRRLYDEKI
jgi:hypothetical protein